jgi:hypothetical protein
LFNPFGFISLLFPTSQLKVAPKLLAVKLHLTIRCGVRYWPASARQSHSDEAAFCRKGSGEVLKESLKKDEKLGGFGTNNSSALL